MHPEEGAFARLVREISTYTATHTNEYAPGHGVSSWLAFALTELIDSPLTDQLHKLSTNAKVLGSQPTDVAARLQRIKPVLGRVAAVLDQQNLADVLEPLNQLMLASADGGETKVFPLPNDERTAKHSANPMMEMLAAWALSRMDRLLERDTWPSVLACETVLTLAGGGKYTGAELNELLRSGDMGPVGCLAAAHLLDQVDPKQARTFAKRGLDLLKLNEFRKDYRLLFEGKTIGSQVLANVLGVIGGASNEQMKGLAAHLGTEDDAFLMQLGNCLRNAKDQPPGIAAWPAFEQHWDPVVRRYLELGLNHFLPQVHFLTDPKALYNRGLTLVDSKNPMRDFVEAAQCFRKAAEQGHGGSQLWLGMLLAGGDGVPQDFAEAMVCYRKALENKEPHAACRIADLYRDGKGVAKNPDEAAKWYRLEAEGGCSGAQYFLGRMLEARLSWPEALKWYRRAADSGHYQAQARLGELLSDGFTVPPDYVEACQWLILATEGRTNRLDEVLLRRVKAKLTPEQQEEAQRRADAVMKRLRDGKPPAQPES